MDTALLRVNVSLKLHYQNHLPLAGHSALRDPGGNAYVMKDSTYDKDQNHQNRPMVGGDELAHTVQLSTVLPTGTCHQIPGTEKNSLFRVTSLAISASICTSHALQLLEHCQQILSSFHLVWGLDPRILVMKQRTSVLMLCRPMIVHRLGAEISAQGTERSKESWLALFRRVTGYCGKRYSDMKCGDLRALRDLQPLKLGVYDAGLLRVAALIFLCSGIHSTKIGIYGEIRKSIPKLRGHVLQNKLTTLTKPNRR